MGAAEAGSVGPDCPLHGVAVDITLEGVGAPFFSIKPNHHFLSRIEEDPGHALPAVFNLPGSQNLNEGPRFKEVLGSHRSEEHTSELQSQSNLVCRLLL